MKYIGRIVSSTIGLVLIAVGIIIFVIVNRTIYDEFDKAAVLIPNNGADKIVDPYLRFIGNEGDKHNIRTYTFGVYNLTNPVETMGGALPKYEEVGPYTYEYIYERMNPTFSEDEEVLSFKLWKRYNVLLTEGSRDPNADTIYHFNLAYAAALAKTGGELQLSIALTAAAMGKIFTRLTDKSFKQQALVAATPKVLGLSWQQLVVANSGSTADACAAWLANTNPSIIPFSILLASPVIGTPSADFTVTLCEKLFTPTNDYSIINADIYLDYAIASPALLAKLVAAGFSNEDAALVIKYQQFERDNYVPAALISSKALPECSNVTECTQPASFGLLQWGQAGGLLQNMSVYDVPGSGLAGVPEFGIVTASSLSLQQAAALSNPASTLNLVTPTSIGTILTIAQKIAAGQTVPPQAYNPYTLPEFLQIAKYTNYIMQTFVDKAIIQDQIFANFQGGPITKHTVHNFLFNVTDPLLSLLTPGAASSSPLSNIRDRAVANATGHTDSVHTGVGDIDLVSAPITFQGEDVLVYNKNITVSGAFGEQLPPNFLFKHPDSQVHAFTEEYARSLTFTKEIGGNFKGIPFLRYRVDDSNWQPNEDYFQTIPFLMNLTSVKGGAPAFLSRPRLKGLNVGYYYKAGLTDLVNKDEDLDVFADYEPRSGKAIQGRYSLQVNGYISGNDGENSPVYNKYTTIKSDVIHPMFWGASIIGATQEQVDILVKAYKVDSFRYAITVILIVVGGFLSMVAVGLFVLEKIIDV